VRAKLKLSGGNKIRYEIDVHNNTTTNPRCILKPILCGEGEEREKEREMWWWVVLVVVVVVGDDDGKTRRRGSGSWTKCVKKTFRETVTSEKASLID